MRKISTTGTPLMYALVTEALLTLCALKTEVSMPALDRTYLIHLPTVEVVTGLWGLINEINSFELERSFSVRKIYSTNVDMVHKEGSSGKDINLTSSDLPGFEVFKCSAMTKLKQSWDCFLKLRSNAHNVCSLWAENKAQSITVFIVRVFKLSCSKGNKVLK